MTAHTPNEPKNRALAASLQELKNSSAWRTLSGELEAVRDRLDARLLGVSPSEVDNTLRYTRHDLEREMRRMISNFLELPDDIIFRLQMEERTMPEV